MAVNLTKKTPEVDAISSAPVQSIAKKQSESDIVMAQIRKSKGDNVVIMGNQVPVVQRIPTGMFEFDKAVGGGFPRGRYSIIYGPEGSGKSNACFCAAAQAQRMPAPCNKVVLIDLEGTYDAEWVSMFGVNPDELIVVKPSFGEEAVDLLDALVRADDVILVIVDSLAVIVASKEIQQSAEKFDVGTSAILIKRMCNKLVIALNEEGKRGHAPAVVMINQTRNKIGVMFGSDETMPGGQTMKFLSSLTIRVSGKNKIVKEVHPDLAAFKETSAVIKKAKVPITSLAFEYEMCVYPSSDLSVGQTNSWNHVSSDLKQLGHLSKVPKGWKLEGPGLKTMEMPTLVTFQDTYLSDASFSTLLQSWIINSHKGKMFLVAASDAAK